jgi:hypothetical protein
MVEVLFGMGLPLAVFGLFALLAMWLGAESRPWFDERPVLDDRPNWFPILRRLPKDDEDDEDDDEPHGGEPEPVPEVALEPRRQPRPAAATRAATSPSGV